ncbi:hypothetical protein AAC387_Pa09g2018 [Persea americana]
MTLSSRTSNSKHNMEDFNHPNEEGFSDPEEEEEEEEEDLNDESTGDELLLSLSPPLILTHSPPTSDLLFFPIFQPNHQNKVPQTHEGTSVHQHDDHSLHQTRHRRNGPRTALDEIITPPFAWATDRPATVHTIKYLLDNNIPIISGEVQCKRCAFRCNIELDLQSKFWDIKVFINRNIERLYQRAPKEWTNPVLLDCKECKQKNCMKPVIPSNLESINWLFLLLGSLLGCCNLEQLKYFCMHNKQHRTGAKDRVLYTTYVTLYKQLDPEGNFVGCTIQHMLHSASNSIQRV